MNHTKFKVAVTQQAPVFLDLAGTVEKTIQLIKEAASNGADLIAFPETWIPGYPWWIWLESPAWGMQFLQRYFNNSLSYDSKEFQQILKAAADNEIMVVLGLSERSGGSLYMGQSIISKKGEVIANRRKLKPTHVERTVFGEGDGSDLKVYDTELGKVGALCCWEHLQPLSKYAMYAQNEQIHIAAWPSFTVYPGMANALGPEVNTSASLIYAVEGQCFVLAPCNVVDQNMLDVLGMDDAHKPLLTLGGGHARIYAPDGRALAEPLPHDQEGILYADIDIDAIALAKGAADPAGHYSRPDVTRLLLDPTRRRPMEYTKTSFEQEGQEQEEVVMN